MPSNVWFERHHLRAGEEIRRSYGAKAKTEKQHGGKGMREKRGDEWRSRIKPKVRTGVKVNKLGKEIKHHWEYPRNLPQGCWGSCKTSGLGPINKGKKVEKGRKENDREKNVGPVIAEKLVISDP